jgi:hypothetical protein
MRLMKRYFWDNSKEEAIKTESNPDHKDEGAISVEEPLKKSADNSNDLYKEIIQLGKAFINGMLLAAPQDIAIQTDLIY